jgi:creatinine amidohydrolase
MYNSIFHGTMVDMTYQEIEKLIHEEAVVLLPIAVIEEHGPHLPLGTDTYLTYSIFKHIQHELNNLNIKSVIAPPFYWGINSITNDFPGSFTVKPDTMKVVLKDTIECLYNWGFNNVYVLNLHGDYLQNKVLLETVKEIYELNPTSKKIYDIVHKSFKVMLGISGSEPYVLVDNKKSEKDDNGQELVVETYLDVHAGSFETSLMLLEYEELVNMEMAKKLESSKTTPELFRSWVKGGSEAREVTPLGYCGNPSNIDLKGAKKFSDDFSRLVAKLIAGSI